MHGGLRRGVSSRFYFDFDTNNLPPSLSLFLPLVEMEKRMSSKYRRNDL